MRQLITLVVVICLGAAMAAGVQASDRPMPAPGPELPWPADTNGFATTSSAVYLGNLDARIGAIEAARQRSPRTELELAQAGALYHRYRIRGRLADAEAALALLDAVIARSPRDIEALPVRARVLSGFHRFAAASIDLDAALAAGVPPGTLLETRREIALASGRYGELRTELASSREPDGGFYELAFRGNLLLQQGDLDAASLQFARAQALATDSSPVPLAWLHVQQGIALLRHGRDAEAARFFQAAHERLPGYTLATEHLAEALTRLGDLAGARTLYRDVIADTNSPEFISALADLERSAGNIELASGLDARAQGLWLDWLQRHPSAFAQHAVPFFLERGQVPRALALARDNIQLRQDVGSYILLAQAEDAAGDLGRACAARASAIGSGLRPPELAELESLATRCEAAVASK